MRGRGRDRPELWRKYDEKRKEEGNVSVLFILAYYLKAEIFNTRNVFEHTPDNIKYTCLFKSFCSRLDVLRAFSPASAISLAGYFRLE